MPPPRHLRVTYSGTLGENGSEAEIWSWGFAVALPGPSSPSKTLLTEKATNLRVNYANSWPSLVDRFVTLTRTRVAIVGANGLVPRDEAGAFIQGDDQVAVPGTGVGSWPVPQCALVVSLQTAASGPTGRGRFYLPMPHAALLGGDLRVTTGRQNDYATMAKTFLDNVNLAMVDIGPTARVSVASGGSVGQGIAPAVRPVTAVRIGRVLDTMQSRRNRLAEEYLSKTLL